MNTTVVKSSISFQKPIWKRLRKYRNKSSVTNTALELYFNRIEAMEEADQEYWKTVEKSLKGKHQDYQSLNPKKEKITDEILEKNLWS